MISTMLLILEGNHAQLKNCILYEITFTNIILVILKCNGNEILEQMLKVKEIEISKEITIKFSCDYILCPVLVELVENLLI